jgi:peptidoglycan hydrolase CwlO-like protein
MKSKHIIVSILIGVTLFLSGCSGGVTKDEYNALSSKYTALEKQYNEMQQQYNAIKAESDDKLKKAKEYDERLTAANAWALFFDIMQVYQRSMDMPEPSSARLLSMSL